jgi:ribosomal-protein-alanine N-acetyltransferase
MNGWRIATANRTDLEPIIAIEQRSFKWPWGRISFEAELSCPTSWNYVVKSANAENPSQIVAYAFLRRVADELHILKIAVTPIQRGNGLATWILNQCFARGARQGANSVFLEVRPSNHAAIGLYQKFGFEEIGRRTNYYMDSNEDALVLMKDLAKNWLPKDKSANLFQIRT